jgi:RNA polymerase sigma factor (sigma-70 family)
MSPVQSCPGRPHGNGHDLNLGQAALLSSSDGGAAHALLDSLAQGNSRAFWELWGLYKGHLYHICLSHMDGVREDAEDALSRSMLRALEKLPHLGTRIENLTAWLSRLTVNLCADMHRERTRRTRRLERIDDILSNLGDSWPADADSPEDVLLSREGYLCLCEAVNNLPDRLREPFALRFFQEMAYGDIAEQLTLSNENVRKRIQQAREILKERLNVPDVARPCRSPRVPPSVALPGRVHGGGKSADAFTKRTAQASSRGSSFGSAA